MDFKVRRVSQYTELTIKDGEDKIYSGFLDDGEALNLAKELISIAEDLLDGEAFQILLKEYLENK